MNPASQPSAIEMFLPWLVLLPLFYFFMIRPQGKRAKEQDSFINNLKRGDAVVTDAGILGTIDGMTEDFVTLEIAPNVKIKMLKKQIAASQDKVLASSAKKPS